MCPIYVGSSPTTIRRATSSESPACMAVSYLPLKQWEKQKRLSGTSYLTCRAFLSTAGLTRRTKVSSSSLWGAWNTFASGPITDLLRSVSAGSEGREHGIVACRSPELLQQEAAGSASKKVPVLRILLAIIPPALMSAWPKTRTAPHWMAYLARNPRHFSPTAVQCRPATRTGLQASAKPGQ